MSKPFRPMLAATLDPADIDKLRYPVLVSPKLDGVRAVVFGGVVRYRSLKPIPNEHVQGLFRHLEGFDGELILGAPTNPDVFRQTSAAVRRREGKPFRVCFWAFDKVADLGCPFMRRAKEVHYFAAYSHSLPLRAVAQTLIGSGEELRQAEGAWLAAGYEGIMIRDPHGPYKFGRSTLKEGYLMKLKRFAQDEAIVIGFEELLHNQNEAKKDAMGLTERSSHAAGMSPAGTLGALTVRALNGPFEGVEFSIGSGLSQTERALIWGSRESHLGRIVTFQHFPQGVLDKPRFPTFKGFRDADDMGAPA
jgi:DNA ligase 1